MYQICSFFGCDKYGSNTNKIPLLHESTYARIARIRNTYKHGARFPHVSVNMAAAQFVYKYPSWSVACIPGLSLPHQLHLATLATQVQLRYYKTCLFVLCLFVLFSPGPKREMYLNFDKGDNFPLMSSALT